MPSSIQFTKQGGRKGVLDSLKLAKTSPEKDTDQKQLDNVRALVAAEINALPDTVKGVRVDVEASDLPNFRSVTVRVTPMVEYVE